MEKLVNMAREKVKAFKWYDFAALKACLLCLGIMIGLLSGKSLKKYTPLFGVIGGMSYIYLVMKLFLPEQRKLAPDEPDDYEEQFDYVTSGN